MPRIHGLMVTKNEADRYIDLVLKHAHTIVDSLFVYDDQSEDDTRQIAVNYGARCVVRADSDPSFTDNEGEFREAAWFWFEKNMQPEVGDWVLAFDADEFLVTDDPWTSPRSEMQRNIAKAGDNNSVIIPFKEMWDDRFPMHRIDGFWDTIEHPRLFAYRPDAEWGHTRLGGGSWPSYVQRATGVRDTRLRMLHYGYARQADRESKYQRYSNQSGAHSSKHIRSILQDGHLAEWRGGLPLCLNR